MATYTRFRNGFEIQTNAAIDKRIYLTKAAMKTAEEDFNLPDVYLAICPDDNGRVYLYNVNNTPNSTTGKFRPIDASLSFDTEEAKEKFEAAIAASSKIQSIEETLGDAQERTGVFAEIDVVDQKVTAVSGRVTTVEGKVNVLEPKVEVLETKVGDDTSGLIKRIKDAEEAIDVVEEDIVQAQEDIEDIQTWINNVKLDGGEIKEVYALTTTLTGVKLDSEDRSIEYKTAKVFEFDLLDGYTTFPTTITVNGVTGVGSTTIQCGNTLASWSISRYDEPPKLYGKLTVQETTGNVAVVISAT